MEEKKIITAQTEPDIWQQLTQDFSSGIPHNYHVEIQHNSHNIELNIVSSPGGNEEGGYEYSNLKATIPSGNDFEFLIQPEDFLNRIGKLFGGQDVILGYPEFDKNVLVKTNNPQRLKDLLADAATRELFVGLSGYSFGIATANENEEKTLELLIQRVVSGEELKKSFQAFSKVLTSIIAYP
jgi:hypothetical protein